MKSKSTQIEFNCSLEDLLSPGFLKKEFEMILSSPVICSENDVKTINKFCDLDGEYWKDIEYIEATTSDGRFLLKINKENGIINLVVEE